MGHDTKINFRLYRLMPLSQTDDKCKQIMGLYRPGKMQKSTPKPVWFVLEFWLLFFECERCTLHIRATLKVCTQISISICMKQKENKLTLRSVCVCVCVYAVTSFKAISFDLNLIMQKKNTINYMNEKSLDSNGLNALYSNKYVRLSFSDGKKQKK